MHLHVNAIYAYGTCVNCRPLKMNSSNSYQEKKDQESVYVDEYAIGAINKLSDIHCYVHKKVLMIC